MVSVNSFHVGSKCYDVSAYTTAVLAARSVFDLAVSVFALNCCNIHISQQYSGYTVAAIADKTS